VLDPVLYPPHQSRSTSSHAHACPTFGTDSVLDRGRKAQIPPGGPVKPGLHHPIPGGPPVVWWDPSRLVLEVQEPVPLRHQQILETGSDRATTSEANYAAWIREREALLATASRPSLTVKTITSLARGTAIQKEIRSKDLASDPAQLHPTTIDPDVQVIVTARPDQKRPGGRRFGALVHAMLASIDLEAGAEAVQALAAVQGRMFAATQEEIQAAITTVHVALQHPIMRRATVSAGKGDVRREAPVLLTLEDGSIAEGVLDLAFREQTSDFDGWSVVDFKTDQEFSTAAGHHVAQVDHYVRAVQAATELPARGIILVV
jgi:ATP-dependent helicase/nuclease subunit A